MSYIPIDKAKIAEFCRKYYVRKLALFGSILRDDFGPDSDVDVLIEFEPGAEIGLFELAEMEAELGTLFGRKVDIVEKAGLRNPFRRHAILKNLEVVYAG